MKIQKSVMTPRQIEVTGIDNIVWVHRLANSLDQQPEVVSTDVKINMTLIVKCKLGQRDKVIKLLKEYEGI